METRRPLAWLGFKGDLDSYFILSNLVFKGLNQAANWPTANQIKRAPAMRLCKNISPGRYKDAQLFRSWASAFLALTRLA
jgi:hypothetical protein